LAKIKDKLMSHTSHSLSKGRRSNVGLFLLSGNSPTKESMMKNLTHAEPYFIMREKKELQKRLLDKNNELLELMQRVEKYLMRIEK